MCLIVFSYRQHPDYPLILVANRDEFYNRAAQPMHYWHDTPNTLAGRDSIGKGTWLGLSTQGRFAAVTNFRGAVNSPKETLRSRGELVCQTLDSEIPLAQTMQSQIARRNTYGGFNLLAADAGNLYYSHSHSSQLRLLPPGLYALSNAKLDSPWPKALAARAQLINAINKTTLQIDDLRNILTDKSTYSDKQLPSTGISLEWERALSAQFIELEAYGTRARTCLLHRRDGATDILEQRFSPAGVEGEDIFRIHTNLLSL